MKWLGYKQGPIRALKLPGDIAQRQKQQHVIDLAADIRELGDEPIHAPTFTIGGEIVAGRDRMAALLLNKAKRCWIRVVDATEQERADLEVSENLYRRQDNRDELIARRVRRVAETIAAERAGSAPTRGAALARQQVGETVQLTQREGGINVPGSASAGGGAGPTSRDVGKARAKVAREIGISAASVKKAEQRAAKKDVGEAPGTASPKDHDTADHAPGAPQQPSRPACPVPDHGVDVPDELRIAIAVIRGSLEHADQQLRQVQGAITFALAKLPQFPGAAYQRVKQQLHEAGATVRQLLPAAICPWCKLTAQQATCNGCLGVGWVTAEKLQAAPRELLAGDVVAHHGEFVPRNWAATKQGATGRKLRIEVDGVAVDVEKLDPPSMELAFEPDGDDAV